MTQNEKDLLLKDLCARLPYGVKGEKYTIRIDEEFVPLIDNEIIIAEDIITLNGCPGYMIKPYLFPLSSMTEEQKEEYYSLADDVTIKPGQGSYFGIKIHCIKLGISDNPHEEVWECVDLDAIDWLNKNHFDYRGLIPMGLAIDATGLNIY